MEIIIAIIIAAFILGALVHIEYQRSLARIRRKNARLTSDDIGNIRSSVYTVLVNMKDAGLPNRVPSAYWREYMDGYLKVCIKHEDSSHHDLIAMLERHKDYHSPEFLCQIYHIMASAVVTRRLQEKYHSEWDKELVNEKTPPANNEKNTTPCGV